MTSIMVWGAPEKMAPRRENDFCPTPWQATEAFMLAEAELLERFDLICEPFCGDGAMAKVMERYGKEVYATDLIDRGYGQGGVDFLKTTSLPSNAMVSNPPFGDLAPLCVEHAILTLGVDYVALILKSHFFHAKSRRELFCRRPPARIHPYGWRVDFTGGGSQHTEMSMFVWDGIVEVGQTRYFPPLLEPQCQNQTDMFSLLKK